MDSVNGVTYMNRSGRVQNVRMTPLSLILSAKRTWYGNESINRLTNMVNQLWVTSFDKTSMISPNMGLVVRSSWAVCNSAAVGGLAQFFLPLPFLGHQKRIQ